MVIKGVVGRDVNISGVSVYGQKIYSVSQQRVPEIEITRLMTNITQNLISAEYLLGLWNYYRD